FKKDTNDTRESAAIYVADALLEEQAEILVYDPKVTEEQIYADLDRLDTRSSQENRARVMVVTDPYAACIGAHAVAIMTEWDEFKTYDYERIYQEMLKPSFVFDGRDIVDQEKMRAIGFQVH